jgi:hypothetical protein
MGIISNEMVELQRIPKEKPSNGAFNSGRFDGGRACARALLCTVYCVLPYVLPLQCNTTIPGTFDCPTYVSNSYIS